MKTASMDSSNGGGPPMDSSNGDGHYGHGEPPKVMSPEALSLFTEGISLILYGWEALQVAVQDEWGGRDSLRKSQELASILLSWFTLSQCDDFSDSIYVLYLRENMVLFFAGKIEDGSIEQVAEELMIMHECCLQGKYESIEKLRKSVSAETPQRRKVNYENDDESSDEEVSNMMVDEPKPKEIVVNKPKPKEVAVNKMKPKELPDKEGWFAVIRRRNRGKG